MTMEPVNMERAREASMDDEEFLLELLDIFLSDTPKQLHLLRKAIESGDAESAANAAHRMKGSSGNVGAVSLGELCEQIEAAGREGRSEVLPALFHDVNSEWGRVQDFLSAIRERTSSSRGAVHRFRDDSA